MSTASERARDRRSLRLEFLEDRKLLSGVAAPHAIAAEVARVQPPVTTITGTVQGLPAAAGLYVTTLPGFHSYSGHGTSRPLGNLLFSSQQVETTTGSTVAITRGSALLITYKGEQIDVHYTGTGTVTNHRPTTISLTGTVNSGTRRFNGETGTFSATGTLAPSTGRLRLTFAIVLDHPAV